MSPRAKEAKKRMGSTVTTFNTFKIENDILRRKKKFLLDFVTTNCRLAEKVIAVL